VRRLPIESSNRKETIIMFARLKLSHVISGFIAVLVGYTGGVAIVFQAIDAVGASQSQANSWMLVMGIGMGISTLILSLYYKMPILTAWSTPGAALLAVSLKGVTIEEAIGAFLLCGLLLALTGVTGWFERLARIIPDSIASAMLAGILFQFGLGIFTSMEIDTTMVALMCTAYLVGKRWWARFAIPLVLVVGAGYAGFAGLFAPVDGFQLSFAQPVFTMPIFSWPVLIGVGVPLYVVTMTSQNMPGVVVLKAAGYKTPVSTALTVTGLTTLILAPFGGYAFNLAAITAAICAGPQADDDPKTRYMASVVTGVVYLGVGIMGAAVISLFLIAPKTLVISIAGLALLNTIGNSLAVALQHRDESEAALVTFLVTVSGVSFFDIGAAVWGLLFGVIVLVTLRVRQKRPA